MEKNGGPAFPRISIDTEYNESEHSFSGGRVYGESSGGMTLRDYFAAAALKGPIAELTGTAQEHAAIAYEYADAMLAERARPP